MFCLRYWRDSHIRRLLGQKEECTPNPHQTNSAKLGKQALSNPEPAPLSPKP